MAHVDSIRGGGAGGISTLGPQGGGAATPLPGGAPPLLDPSGCSAALQLLEGLRAAPEGGDGQNRYLQELVACSRDRSEAAALASASGALQELAALLGSPHDTTRGPAALLLGNIASASPHHRAQLCEMGVLQTAGGLAAGGLKEAAFAVSQLVRQPGAPLTDAHLGCLCALLCQPRARFIFDVMHALPKDMPDVTRVGQHIDPKALITLLQDTSRSARLQALELASGLAEWCPGMAQGLAEAGLLGVAAPLVSSEEERLRGAGCWLLAIFVRRGWAAVVADACLVPLVGGLSGGGLRAAPCLRLLLALFRSGTTEQLRPAVQAGLVPALVALLRDPGQGVPLSVVLQLMQLVFLKGCDASSPENPWKALAVEAGIGDALGLWHADPQVKQFLSEHFTD